MRKRLWTRQNTLAISPIPFRRSSAVEQLTVNQFVVGSIPTAGAIFHHINIVYMAMTAYTVSLGTLFGVS